MIGCSRVNGLPKFLIYYQIKIPINPSADANQVIAARDSSFSQLPVVNANIQQPWAFHSARSHFLHGYLLTWQCSEKFGIGKAEPATVQLLEFSRHLLKKSKKQ